MKLKITSKDGITSVVHVETGETLFVEALRFEHLGPDELPRLTITIADVKHEIEVDAEIDPTQVKRVDEKTWRNREAML